MTEDEMALIDGMARRNFISYCIATDATFRENWHLEEIGNKLEEIENGSFRARGKKILIITMPPRYGKSQTTTINFPSWYLGKHPEQEIITASYSGELAQIFGGKTRSKLETPQYKRIFPSVWLKEDEKAKAHWLTNKGGGYSSVGVGGVMTGRGAHLLTIDDPIKNKEEADSELIREKIWDWFFTTAYSRLEPGGVCVIILTRWHLDDLAGRILANKELAGVSEVISFPEIAEEDEQYRKKGETLWALRYPLEEALERRRAFEEAGKLREYMALYQQRPIMGETADFKEEYFKYYEENELPEDFTIDITVDPAISKRKEACNTAIVAVCKNDNNPFWYVLDYKRGKYNPFELIKNTLDMACSFVKLYPDKTIRIWVEGVAYQESLKYYFEEAMNKLVQETKNPNHYFFIDTFIDRSDKEQRIKGLVPLFKIGVIRLRSWMTELKTEALEFPVGRLKDLMDALAFHLKIKQNTFEAMQEQEDKVVLNGNVMEKLNAIRYSLNRPDPISEALR